MYYEIDPAVDSYVEKKSGKAYGTWKYDCHQHFLEWGGEDIPLEFVARPEQWRFLVSDFTDEARMVISH